MAIAIRKKTVLVLLALLLLGILASILVLLRQESKLLSYELYQRGGNNLVAVVRTSSKSKLPFNPWVYLNGKKLKMCQKDSEDPCLDKFVRGDNYNFLSFSNLDADTQYQLRWVDTLRALINSSSNGTSVTTALSSETPVLERAYGRILDEDGYPIRNALLTITDMESGNSYASVTNDKGTYSIDLIKKEEGYRQTVRAESMWGAESEIVISSDRNKPLPDMVVETPPENLSSQLATPAFAANSCIADTDRGGIRAQCNDKTDWVTVLYTGECPASENKFRLGVIKHVTSTQFHKAGSIKLKLKDQQTGEFVKDKSGKELQVDNGKYVNLSQVELVEGKKYVIHAFDGGTECLNTDGPEPMIVYSKPKGKTIPSKEKPGYGVNPIPPMTEEMNLCKKVGENFAVTYEVASSDMQKAVDVNMRWGEALITDLNDIGNYAKSVANGKNMGINMILRICYKNGCNINNGSAYGSAVVEVFNQLVSSGNLPEDGLFVHAGHNEPNNAEYRDPSEEARFIIDFINTIDSAGVLGNKMGEASIKVLGPNLDLYRTANGTWPGCNDGCDDPNPHPIYTAQSYIDEMLKVGGFSEAAGKIWAWAVNDYLHDRGPDAVVADIETFHNAYLTQRGLPENIVITELGNFGAAPDPKPSHPWSVLADTIAALDGLEYVQAILLFDSIGANRDPNYEYHKELWENPSLLKSLFSNCSVGTYNIPQEGRTPVFPGGMGGGNAPQTPTGIPVAGVQGHGGGQNGGGGGTGGYGAGYNGADPCLGNVCVGKEYQNYAVASVGMLNGNFENEFVSDGAAELFVPGFWHVWYQNGCQGDMCGNFSCKANDPTANPDSFCRRPEYRQTNGEENRKVDGQKGLVYFTTYGTHHAGIYQHIDLLEGGENKVKFTVSGSSWSDGPEEQQPITGSFQGRIGIDPTGGIDPNSGSIVWSEWKELPNVGPGDSANFVPFEVTVTTSSNLITLFIASNNEHPYRNSDSYWDAAELEVNEKFRAGNATPGLTYQGPTGGGGAGGGTDPAGMKCEPGIGAGTPLENACWVKLETVSCSQLCPEGWYYDFKGIWGSTSGPGECPMNVQDTSECLKCDYLPPADGKLGISCCLTMCQPNPPAEGGGSVKGETSSPNTEASVLGEWSESGVVLPSRGEYVIEAKDTFIVDPIYVSNFSNNPLEIPLFIDLNQNGKQDKGEQKIPNASFIKMERIGDVAQYKLIEGHNLISLPFHSQNVQTASQLLEQIMEQGGLATAVATYRNSGDKTGWIVYNKVGSQSYGEDFEIRQSDSLLLVVREKVDLKLRGTSFDDPVKAYLRPGWNLIAIKGIRQGYTASNLIESINKVDGIASSTIAIWDSQKGRYTQYTVSESESFGEDVQLNDQIGIFVLVEEGDGYWTPE